MSDYIIGVDRDGQPYIEHAWGRRGNNQNHKYIMKVKEGLRTRYFYTQEEVRAYQQGLKSKAQNVADKAKEKASDVVGSVRENSTLLNVGNQYNAAKRAYQNSKSFDPQTAKWGKEGYDSNNTLGGRIYKTQEKAKNAADKLKETVKEKSGANAKKDLERVRANADLTGRVARRLTDKGIDTISESFHEKDPVKSDKLFNQGLSQRDAGWRLSDNSREKLQNAQRRYDKTPLGRIDKAKNTFEGIKTDVELAAWDASKEAKKALSKVNHFLYDKELDVEIAVDRTKRRLKKK